MSDVDDSFTVQTFFGSSLANIYQQDLSSDVYVQRGEILKAKISFQKVISISWFIFDMIRKLNNAIQGTSAAHQT